MPLGKRISASSQSVKLTRLCLEYGAGPAVAKWRDHSIFQFPGHNGRDRPPSTFARQNQSFTTNVPVNWPPRQHQPPTVLVGLPNSPGLSKFTDELGVLKFGA